MSLTDLDVANLVNGIYAYPGDPAIAWDHFDSGASDDDVYWAVKIVNGVSVVVFRGSTTAEDWERDAETAFWVDRDLGEVHLGFLQGMKDVWQEVGPTLKAGAWVSSGHSLGAARAQILAALGVVAACPPAAVVVLGEPRPCFAKMAGILAAYPNRSYRNRDSDGHDLVTDLPPYLPPAFPYVHGGYSRPLIDISQSPSDPNDWSPFRYHHMPPYQAAVSKLNPMPTI